MLEKLQKKPFTNITMKKTKYAFCANVPLSMVAKPRAPPNAIIPERRSTFIMLALTVGVRQMVTAIGTFTAWKQELL